MAQRTREARHPTVARLLLALALGLAGVANGGELARLHRELVGEAPPAAPATEAPADARRGFMPLQPLPERTPVPAIERLGFEALPCRGTCPAFTVVFQADGTFRYVGERHVARLGEGSGRVPTHALEQVMRYVEAIGFRELADTYPTRFADVATTYTMVDWGDAVKVVENQGGSAPATVWGLEQLLQGLLREAQWD